MNEKQIVYDTVIINYKLSNIQKRTKQIPKSNQSNRQTIKQPKLLRIQQSQLLEKLLSKMGKFLPLRIIFMSTFLVIALSSQQSLPYSLNKINAEQKNVFKQSINGRTLNGNWECVQELFYQPAQCKYFPMSMDADKMIMQTNQFFEPTTFFQQKNQGHLQGFFYSSGDDKIANKLYLLLFRQNHRTDQVIELDIDLSKADRFELQTEKNHTKMVAYQQQNLITTANLYENEELFVKYDLSIYVEVFVLQEGYKLMHQNYQNKDIKVPIHVRIFSQSLSFVSQLKSPQNNQTMMILFGLAMLQTIFICLNPSASQQNVSKTRSIMFRISQWFILQMYAFIIVFSKEYIKLGMKYFDTDLGYLIYLGLGNIGIGLLFLRKYEMVLEKFTNKRMLLFAVLFFIAYWYLASKYFHDAFFWIIELTIMMHLQILHSMLNGGKGGLPYDLMGFMIVSRLPFIYMGTSTENIWKMPVMDSQYVKLLMGLFLLHLIIIVFQSIKGGQFLVPNKIIPGYFNYYISRQSNHPQLNQECPICTSLLSKAPDSEQVTQTIENSSIHSMQSGQQIQIETTHTNITEMKSTNKQDISNNKNIDTHIRSVKVMKTPCNHIFHIDCLTKWMQNKLVCPYCRSTLPQLASLEKQ